MLAFIENESLQYKYAHLTLSGSFSNILAIALCFFFTLLPKYFFVTVMEKVISLSTLKIDLILCCSSTLHVLDHNT